MKLKTNLLLFLRIVVIGLILGMIVYIGASGLGFDIFEWVGGAREEYNERSNELCGDSKFVRTRVPGERCLGIEESQDECLIIRFSGGLCNRLRNMLGYFYVSEHLGIRVNYIWGVNTVESTYKKHFLRPPDHAHVRVFDDGDPAIRDIEKNLNMSCKFLGTGSSKMGRIAWPEIFDLYDLSHEKRWGFPSCYNPVEEISRIIRPEIRETINSFFEEHDFFENTVGIHVRRNEGLFAQLKEEDEKLFRILNVEVLRNSKVRFFVACDSKEYQDLLKEEYSSRVIVFSELGAGSGLGHLRESGLLHAIADLFLLSRTQKIVYYSKGSSFSQLARVLQEFSNVELRPNNRCYKYRVFV